MVPPVAFFFTPDISDGKLRMNCMIWAFHHILSDYYCIIIIMFIMNHRLLNICLCSLFLLFVSASIVLVFG